jgi:hypothetical protein
VVAGGRLVVYGMVGGLAVCAANASSINLVR